MESLVSTKGHTEMGTKSGFVAFPLEKRRDVIIPHTPIDFEV